MYKYLFLGTINPQRAQLSISFEIGFSHISSQNTGMVSCSVILNQLAMWINTETEWDIFDLRNVASNVIQNEINIIGYLRGYYYNAEITRIICSELNIDYVFGIDIPCLSILNSQVKFQEESESIRLKMFGEHGPLLHRCFNDLNNAMRSAEDTGFYCYRAVEALRHHCAAQAGIAAEDKKRQWARFRELSSCDEARLLALKKAADPVRHGEVDLITSADRERLLMETWNIVAQYLSAIPIHRI